MFRRTFDVRTGDGGARFDGTFTDVVGRASRVPRRHEGWQSVTYKGRRYQLHGGIRTNWFIRLNAPIQGGGAA